MRREWRAVQGATSPQSPAWCRCKAREITLAGSHAAADGVGGSEPFISRIEVTDWEPEEE